MDAEVHKSAKNAVIEACHTAGVKLIVYMIHHSILQPEWKAEYALNSVLVAFNGIFLRDQDDYGIVVIDRQPDQAGSYGMLKRKFLEGLSVGDSGFPGTLDRTVMFASICDGASHVSSAVDIVLGGFRWVVNEIDNPKVRATQRTIFTNVAQMMYGKEEDGRFKIRERGLILRPKDIKVPKYQDDYDVLLAYFAELISE